LIDPKLFRTSNFGDAIHRLTYRNPGQGSRDILGGHRLEKHIFRA
jgi:hypothetical protein